MSWVGRLRDIPRSSAKRLILVPRPISPSFLSYFPRVCSSREFSIDSTNYSKPYIRWALYRRLLRGMRSFPTVNREKIYRSIQEEFRDPVKASRYYDESSELKRRLELAEESVGKVSMYTTQTSGPEADSSDWAVNMEENPMRKKES